MSTEQKPGDPADKATDATADGAFGGVQTHNHRAGYGDDKLERLIDYLRRNPRATLASGEGALLLAEIDWLRAAATDSAIHYTDARAEIDRLRRILDSLRDVLKIGQIYADEGHVARALRLWQAAICDAVAAAEQEVGGDERND